MTNLGKYSNFLKEIFLILKSQISSYITSLKIIGNKDFNKLPFHPLGGKIIGPVQYIFDGSPMIYPHGSDRVHNIYRLTKGAPEPEEIAIFLKIIKKVSQNGIMMEVGAGGGFYTIIASKFAGFKKFILVEANPKTITMLNQNLVLNNLKSRSIIIDKAVTNIEGKLINFQEMGYASAIASKGEYTVKTVTVDNLVKHLKLKKINLVNMDIQGEELNALKGMKQLLSKKNIEFLMIGTHSVDLHNRCLSYLKSYRYSILFSKDQNKSSSYDGILVAANHI